MFSVSAQVKVWLVGSGLFSCPFSPHRLRKQQQVWSAQHFGPERVLRRGGERLSESAVLRPPAALQHPHPGQLWAGGYHCHQAAQVHVLLLPLLSTRGEQNTSGSSLLFSCHIWRMWIQISPNLPHSWRCRLPPVTLWATSYSSGTLSPLNSLSPTSTMSLFWGSTGPSADGAACQMSTLRWVHPNILIYKICPPQMHLSAGSVFPIMARLLGPVAMDALDAGLFHASVSFVKLQREGIWVSAADMGHWNIIFPSRFFSSCFKVITGDTKTAFFCGSGQLDERGWD